MDFGGPNMNMMGLGGLTGMPGMMNPEALLAGMGPDVMQGMGMMPGMMGGMGMLMGGAGMPGPMGAGPTIRPTPPPPPGPPPPGPASQPPPPGKGLYWKTRICQKWSEGRCPYSDQACNYAHGKHELRYVSPEQIKAAEASKAAAEEAQKGGGQQQGGVEEREGGSERGTQLAHPPLQGRQGGPQGGGREMLDFRKTKLCIQFMQSGGYCRAGDNCKYAHGPGELRTPQPMGQAGGPPMMQEGAAMGPRPGFRPPPPPGGGPPGSMMGPRPPPPAGPPLPGHGMPSPRHGPPRSPLDGWGGMQEGSPGEEGWREGEGGPRPPQPPEVPLLERVRAMCTLLGVGEGDLRPEPTAVQAAMAAARSGAAFWENAYADSIESFVRQQQHHAAAY